MDIRRCGHHRTRSESNPFEYDPWSCFETMELYQLYFPSRSIRWCFFEVHPDMDHNISLLHEFDDPIGLSSLPAVAYRSHRSQIDHNRIVVKDTVLDGENQ